MARAIALRLIVWGGLVCAVLIYSGNLRWPQRQYETSESAEQTAEAPEAKTPSGPAWPHLRGPAYSGISEETGLADTWPPGGPSLVWKRDIGHGYSGIVAVGNRLFTQRQTATEQSVLCLDPRTGHPLWEHRYGWAYEPGGMYPGPRATPTWNAGRLYFASPEGLVGCLRADNGARVWEVQVNKRFGGRGTEFGYACSPLVEAGKVILPVGGPQASVIALGALDGSLVWASGSEPASYCSPVPITLAGRRLVVAFMQNALALVDLESGMWLWRQEYSHGYDEHAAIPVYKEPYLAVMLPFRAGADVYRLEAPHATSTESGRARVTARLVGHSAELSNDIASSVLTGGFVYGFELSEPQANGRRPSRGRFKCLEFPSLKVRWTTDRVGHATIVAAEGKLFLFNDKGELILARANPDRYDELGRAAVFRGEICWTAPTLHGGRIYLRSPTQAACLDVRTSPSPGQVHLDQTPRSGPTPSIDLPASEPFDWIRLIGKEREYPFDPPDAREFTRWYLWSLFGALLGAWAVAGIVGLAARLSGGVAGRSASWVSIMVFWSAATVLGVVVTPVANGISEGFVFTWPVSVFVIHQGALAAVVRSNDRFHSRRLRWLAPAAAIAFVIACATYYDLCRRVNLALAWVFLAGFVASWPLAIPLAYRFGKIRGMSSQAVWSCLAFTLYFWASAALLWVRTVWRR